MGAEPRAAPGDTDEGLRTVSRLTGLRALILHPALRTTALIAAGGVALMLANVLYARLLAPDDFGRLVLVQSLALVAMGLLPLGVDNLVVRKEVGSPGRAIAFVLAAGLALTGLAAAAGLWLGADARVTACVALAGVAGAATRLIASVAQSEQRFFSSQLVSQSPLVLFLAAAAFHSLGGAASWQAAATAFVLSYVTAALIGSMAARPRAPVGEAAAPLGQLLARSAALTGIFASLLLLNQLERLIAAAVLDMHELGALGLATTLLASPFRMLSAGVGYTLMPRLRACESPRERRRLIRSEFLVAMAVGLPAALLLLVLVPPLVDWLFEDAYDISGGLVAALLVLGLVRLNSGLFSAATNALAGTRLLQLFNLSGWFATALAAAAAVALAGFGSTGIVVGVTFGWLLRIACAAWLIRKAL